VKAHENNYDGSSDGIVFGSSDGDGFGGGKIGK
jgi:hypothetical protein